MRGIKLIFVMLILVLVGCSTSDFMSDIIKKKGDKKDGGGGPGVTVIVIVGSEEKVSIMDNGQIKREPATPDETSETKKDELEKKK